MKILPFFKILFINFILFDKLKKITSYVIILLSRLSYCLKIDIHHIKYTAQSDLYLTTIFDNSCDRIDTTTITKLLNNHRAQHIAMHIMGHKQIYHI
jgi:hypothetical protein